MFSPRRRYKIGLARGSAVPDSLLEGTLLPGREWFLAQETSIEDHAIDRITRFHGCAVCVPCPVCAG